MRWLALALLLAGPGCAEFTRPELGVCGNRVVESGEACDDPDDPDCGNRNDPAIACRILCTPGISDPGCPPGDLCGRDQVCRAPSGDFQSDPLRIDARGVASISVADIDGDGWQDLVARVDDGLDVLHFEAGSLAEVVEVARPAVGVAALGDLDADGLHDIFFTPSAEATPGTVGSTGITVWTGSGSRTPTAQRFSTLRTDGDFARLLSPVPERDRVLEVLSADTARQWSTDALAPSTAAPLGIGAAELGRAVAIADLDGGQCEAPEGRAPFPRPEIALAPIGGSEVRLLSLCADETEPVPLPSVPMPAGHALGDAGSFFADHDDDGNLDLVVQSDDGEVWIAYGAGDGGFGDGFAAAPLLDARGHDESRLLAAADLDDDGALELVTEASYIGAPGACDGIDCELVPWETPARWSVVLDINADGTPDVATLHDASLGVHLGDPLNRGRFKEHTHALLGPTRELVTGDFNRDTIEDVAFVEESDQLGGATAQVAVFFGGGVDDWHIERFGPFVDIDTIAVDQQSIVVARTFDGQGRAAGAFVRPDAPTHDFGATPSASVVVHHATGVSVAGVAAIADEPGPRLVDFGFADGTLSPHDVVLGDGLPAVVDAATVLVAAVDLGGAGVDHLVVAGAMADEGRVWTAERDADGRWVVIDELAIGPGFARASSTPTGASSPGSTIAVGDVDGDGDPDLLLTTDAALPAVVALKNDGGALRLEGDGLLFSEALPGFEFANVVPWHADADGRPQWLVAGEDGIGVAAIDLGRGLILVDERLEISAAALAAAYIDDDGLLDLVAATDDQLRVYLAQERVPGE